MDVDEVDYQGLFEVIRAENERLRLQIVGLKNNGYTSIDKMKDLWVKACKHPLFVTYVLIGAYIIFNVVELVFAHLRGNNEK